MVSAGGIPVFGIGDLYPVKTGGQKATYHLFGALNQVRPCRYVFLEPGATGTDEGIYPNGLRYQRIGGRAAKSWRNALIAPKLLYGDGPTRNLLRTARTRSIVDALAGFAARSPTVIFATPWIYPVLAPRIQATQQVVYDSQNFEPQLLRERMAAGTLDARSLQAMCEAERSLSRRADVLLACSPIDAEAYTTEFGVDPKRLHLGFKGASVPAQPMLREAVEPPVATFVGSDWPANNEAALAVATRIAPRLPQVRFRLIGSCCLRLPKQLPPNVEALGFVDDLEAQLRHTSVALNPITSGSGINMKLLEYLTLGIPVVSTVFGARGLPPEAMPALEIATIDDFPAAIEGLLQSPERLQQRGREGHGYARRHLDWPLLGARLSALLAG